MAKHAAQPYVAGTPEALVTGQIMLSFVENIQSEYIMPLLPKHGLENIDPDKWYPHQSWMNVLKELNDEHGEAASSIFVAFGRKAVEKAVMPPEITTIPQVLNLLHAIHHMNLQNVPEDEGYSLREISPQHYWVWQNTPNPDDAIYGFIWGLCARFKKPNELFSVKILDNPEPDEHPGTLFEIKWGPNPEDVD